MTLVVFLALIAVGQFAGHKGDASRNQDRQQLRLPRARRRSRRRRSPVSQVGINALANETGHLRVSINFTWLLLTGFLVLFMQVGFAFLVTGLTRAKNAGHMMMMNIAAFAVAFLAYYAVRLRVPVRWRRAGREPRRRRRRSPGSSVTATRACIGTHGFFLQTGGTYDVGVMAFFLFQVVFMETAGYIIIGAIAERINFRTFILAEIAMGALIYPDLRHVGVGRRLARASSASRCDLGHGAVDFAGSGVVHATGGWAALALAMLLGPRIGKFNEGRNAERDSRATTSATS